MSIQHIAMVLEAGGLCAQEKAVLTAFCNHTDPAGKTYAGEERLMRESGMPRTTFQRWRGQLVTRKLLISRRKGRKGGGRSTSDTWVNLTLLQSLRDPWFDQQAAARQEEPNPFDCQGHDESNGPASGAKGRGNGPASGAINGPASGAYAAPPVEPVTLINPQGEPSETLFADPPSSATASPPPAADRDFDEFWTAYPKKVGKPAAKTKWRAAIKRGADPQHIIRFAAEQAAIWQRHQKDPQYIPHPATWLGQARYLDELDTPAPATAKGHQPYRNPTDLDLYDEEF